MPQLSFSAPLTEIDHKKAYAAIDPAQSSLSAAGKTVFITAGHTGIGYVIAQNFAIPNASHIILLARRTQVLQSAVKELSAAHPKTQFHYFVASTTNTPKIKIIFADIRSAISPNIEILVTSAAYIPTSADALELSAREMVLAFETNVFANIHLTKEFLSDISVLSPGREKIILDVSSIAAHVIFPKLGNYGITKITFSLWLTHVQQGMKETPLRVHSFHPGAVLTEAARKFAMNEDTMPWDDVQLPGQFAVWLASDEGAFLKGRFVWANGDVQELVEKREDLERDADLFKIGLVGN